MVRKQFNLDIGRRLKVLRVVNGLTQDEMAEKLDISTRQYRRYENGDSELQMKAFFLLGMMDGIDTNYLTTGQTQEDMVIEWAISRMPEEEFQQNHNKVNELQDYYDAERYDEAIALGNEIISTLYNFYNDNILNYSIEKKRDVEKCNINTGMLEKRYNHLCMKA